MKKLKKLCNSIKMRDKVLSLIILVLIIAIIAIVVIRFVQQRDYIQLLSDIILIIVLLALGIAFWVNVFGNAYRDNKTEEILKELKKNRD